MKFLRKFNEHASYEAELNVGGGLDISSPNVSYCEDVKDVHYTPYNLVRFYVGEITGTTPQTVKIYTDSSTSIPIQVSEGNKWYSYAIPKNKGLHSIKSGVFNHDAGWTNGIVKKVAIRADINYISNIDDGINELFNIIPTSTIEVSFNGIDTSNVTDMSAMFFGCKGLTSLNLSGWDTSKVTDMGAMFRYCTNLATLDLSGWVIIGDATDTSCMFCNCDSLKTIRMVGCSQETINAISGVKPSGATIVTK